MKYETPHSPHALNMTEVYKQAMHELAKPYPSIRLNNWRLFSDMTGGFRLREFTIFCGPTGAGKTTFLANLSAQLLLQNVKHFVMSVETGHTDFMKRIVSVLEGRDVNTGDALHASELARITSKHERALTSDSIEFSLYDNRVPVETLIKDLTYMVQKKGCKIAMIDNLNFFLEVTTAANQIVEMDRVVHELVIFAKQFDVHIIMVMHPKKTQLGNRVTSEFDIKGSSTAVQEAHNIFLFNRPDPETLDQKDRSPFDRELMIAKMRRRGQFVGQTLIYKNNGTQYVEKGIL